MNGCRGVCVEYLRCGLVVDMSGSVKNHHLNSINAELVKCVKELGILCPDRCLFNLDKGANDSAESFQDKQRRIEEENYSTILGMIDYRADILEQSDIERYISEFKLLLKTGIDASKLSMINTKIKNQHLYARISALNESIIRRLEACQAMASSLQYGGTYRVVQVIEQMKREKGSLCLKISNMSTDLSRLVNSIIIK